MGKVFSRRNMKYLAQMISSLSDKDDKLDPYTLRRISEIISGIADKLDTPESFYAGYGSGVKLFTSCIPMDTSGLNEKEDR